VFIYEVAIENGKGKFPLLRQSKIFLRVPYHRMNQEMRRIARLGGKILSITPVGSSLELRTAPGTELPWWVEISTSQPHCLYYFGPFESAVEAEVYQPGYVEDLQREGAEEIRVEIKQCHPQILTQEFSNI
jgi:hypothetical protein